MRAWFTARAVVGRVVLPVVMGLTLGWLASAIWRADQRHDAACVSDGSVGSCFSMGPLLALVGVAVAAVAAWLALRAARVARSFAAAALGVLLAVAAIQLYEAVLVGTVVPPVWFIQLVAAAGLLVAVAAVRPGTPLWATWIVVLAVPLTIGVSPFLGTHTERAQKERDFQALSVPLLAPHLDGFHLVSAYPVPRAGALLLDVARDGRDSRAYLVVVRVPAGFAPPQRCGPNHASLDTGDAGAACRVVAPDEWIREFPDDVGYIVRRGDLLLVGDANPNDISPPELVAILHSLQQVPVATLMSLQ